MAKRREMLKAMAALPLGMAIAPATAAVPTLSEGAVAGCKASSIADRLLQAYPARRSLAAIGEAYWQGAAGDTPCLTQAIHALLERIGLQDHHLHGLSSADVRDRLKAKTAEDFQDGRIVPVRGWLLGETEARLCAIAALHKI